MTRISLMFRSLVMTHALAGCAAAAAADGAIEIGSRRELFVDKFLVQSMKGGAKLLLHRPERREVVLRTDAPWEGNASAFQSVFKDGDLYRMYYRGIHYRHSGLPAQALADHPWFLCYAESDDGIHWRKPKLGLFEFNGSKDNNIILTPDFLKDIGGDPAHTAAFKDENPKCPADAKYKIVVVGHKPKRGMYVLKSADGIHFTIMSREPSVTKGAFDSQNLMFWDPVNKVYREYHRGFKDGVRDILTASSKDILHFPEPQWLKYPGAAKEHLYTNAIRPYYRAPHILMGFPMRYTDRGWSVPMMALPELDERLARAKAHPRYGTAITDGLFMTSRDGLTFHRWREAFIRPGPRKKDSWVYGDNFIFWGMVETKSHLEDAPNEISLYATEGYWEGVCTDVRRYTLRLDGFVSVNAPARGGELVTKPLVFKGGNLVINAATSGAGSIQVEIQDADGNPIKGYALADCPEIFCDDVEYVVRWNVTGGDVRPLAGKPVRLRFVLKDADLYSFQFVPYRREPKWPDLSPYGGMPAKSPNRKPFVVIDDDFQSVKAGTAPTSADLDPKKGRSGWFISEGSPGRVQVLCDDPIGSGKPGENHYLRVERKRSIREGGRAWVWLSPRDAADSANGVVEVEARIWVPSSNRYCVDIDAFDNRPNEYGRRAFHVRFYPDGTVSYYRKKKNPIPGLKIKTDAWQDVKIRADLRRATFDLTVAGKTVKDLPFADDTVHRIQTIGFVPNTNGCVLYVDRVRVRVEP